MYVHVCVCHLIIMRAGVHEALLDGILEQIIIIAGQAVVGGGGRVPVPDAQPEAALVDAARETSARVRVRGHTDHVRHRALRREDVAERDARV